MSPPAPPNMEDYILEFGLVTGGQERICEERRKQDITRSSSTSASTSGGHELKKQKADDEDADQVRRNSFPEPERHNLAETPRQPAQGQAREEPQTTADFWDTIGSSTTWRRI